MARTFADEVVQTSQTTGAGTYDLDPTPPGGYRSFRQGYADLDEPYVAVRNDGNTKWELNKPTVLTYGAPDRIARNVYLSTNGNAAVSWVTDDLPLTLYVPSSAQLLEMAITGWLATTRHWLLRAGAFWWDSTAGVAVGWVYKLATGAATNARIGYYDAVKAEYFPDGRRRFVDNGAANLVMTADHAGQTVKFDVTAAGRTFTLLAGATTGIGPGFPVHVLPYGGNNCVSLIPDAGDGIDGGADGIAVPLPAGRVTAIWWDDVAGGWQTDMAAGLIPDPGGRLTLESGVSVSSTDQAGKATVYYTSHRNNYGILRAGAGFAMYPFSELSNDLTQSVTGKAGPAAAGPYQAIDTFVWNDAGAIRLTRGPKWIKSGAVTVTIATPAVAGWTAHGLYDGATFRWPSTTGALPTGVALNTDYFITKVDANSFKLSTTLANQVAGTYIATSGSQSGVHTGENYTVERGTGAGTTELETVKGVRVNKVAITNGPAAGQGVYVGSIYCNSASQVDFKLGSVAAGGGEAIVGIWNAYNRVDAGGSVRFSNDSWNNTSPSTVLLSALSATGRVSAVCGLKEEPLRAIYNSTVSASAAGGSGICFNSSSAFSGTQGYHHTGGVTGAAGAASGAFQGFAYMASAEAPWAGSNITAYGDAGFPLLTQFGVMWQWRY